MKKVQLLMALLALTFTLGSCKKCADCACSSSIEFEWGSAWAESDKENIETTVTDEYNADYPDESVELCEKRGDFDDAVDTYEKKSVNDSLSTGSGDFTYGYQYNRLCTCSE